MEAAMRTTQQLSITLPNDMADVVKTKVKTGEYASESEVIRDGLRALLARDRAVESWLHNQVGPAYDALKADPSRAVTADQVRARLAAEHTGSSPPKSMPKSSLPSCTATSRRRRRLTLPLATPRQSSPIAKACARFHCAAPCATMCGPACASRTTASAP